MAYQKQNWVNNNKNTPLSAERLTHIENGIKTVEEDLNDAISTVEEDLNDAISTETNGRILGDSILEGLITRLEDSTYTKTQINEKLRNLPYLNIGEISLLSVTDIYNLLYGDTNLKERISLFQVDLSYFAMNYQKVEAVFEFRLIPVNTWQVTITLQIDERIIKFVTQSGLSSWRKYVLTALFKHQISFTDSNNNVFNLTLINQERNSLTNVSYLFNTLYYKNTISITGTIDNETNSSHFIVFNVVLQDDHMLYFLVYNKTSEVTNTMLISTSTTFTNYSDIVTPYQN